MDCCFNLHRWCSSPVLFLLIEVGYDVQQAANEGVGSCRAAGARGGGLRSEHSTAPLCVSQLLLHLHILLPEQGEVLLQFGHLLCDNGEIAGERLRGGKKICMKENDISSIISHNLDIKHTASVLVQSRYLLADNWQINDWETNNVNWFVWCKTFFIAGGIRKFSISYIKSNLPVLFKLYIFLKLLNTEG